MTRGFAAAQCGKAPPFRPALYFSHEARPQAQPSGILSIDGKAKPYRTVRRQSRSRLLSRIRDQHDVAGNHTF
jgi:hypothetical protein